MTETTDTIRSEEPAKKERSIIFIIVNAIALLILPIAIAASILILTLLCPDFYTGILKMGGFITAFVEAKNIQTDQAINEEIEKELDITGANEVLNRTKARYEVAEAAYKELNRDGEYAPLEERRTELKDMDWAREKDSFATKDEFKAYRKAELAKTEQALDQLDEYRDANADGIKKARKEMNAAQEEYGDALSDLEDRNKKAEKIIAKHSDTTVNRVYGDLEIIEKPLTKILNEKLINGPVRDEIAFMLDFMSDYETQIDRRAVYYGRTAEGRRSLMVKVPEISISLRVDDGTGRKKHVLSQLLVEEIDRLYNLRSKGLLKTIFSMSDSSLGEYLGGKQLAKLGLTLNGGVIRRPAGVLSGDAAEYFVLAMQVMTYGRYAPYGVAGLLVMYALFLVFSSVEGRRRLAALKRFLIYPSFLILALCCALLLSSRYLLDLYPGFIENIMARGFAKHLSFVTAWSFAMPLMAVFGVLFVIGLVLRKVLARTGAVKET